MVLRTVYNHLYTTPLSDNHSPFHSWIWVSKCMPSSHKNQFSFSLPICAKSIWCTISPHVSTVQGHKGKLFFCHIAILIVLQIVNIFISVPLAHVYFTIPFWSGFKLLRATNRTRGNMCRNSSYNNMGLQPQCPKKAGSGSLQLVLAEACRSPDSETPHANF